jgi:hypothetical protein
MSKRFRWYNWRSRSAGLAARRATVVEMLLAQKREEAELLERHGLQGEAALVRKEISEVEDQLRKMQSASDRVLAARNPKPE